MPGDCPASLPLLRLACGKHSAPSRTPFRSTTKTVRLPTGIAFTFRPECCSESKRNGVQLQTGIAFTFDRIPQVVHHGRDTDKDELIQVGVGNKRFLPIVRSDLALVCKLDILLLGDRRIVLQHTDIDNKIKTLLDALQLPQANQYCDDEEDPLYCLLENDSLVSELRVTVDYLLCPPDQVIKGPKISEYTGEPTVSASHAIALIGVAVKPTKIMVGNLDFA
jgi:hypothetical protein